MNTHVKGLSALGLALVATWAWAQADQLEGDNAPSRNSDVSVDQQAPLEEISRINVNFPAVSHEHQLLRSDFAVYGYVKASEAVELSPGVIATRHTVEVMDSWRRDAGSELVIQVLGGELNGIRTLSDSNPGLEVGDEGVFYALAEGADQTALLSFGPRSFEPSELLDGVPSLRSTGGWQSVVERRENDLQILAAAPQTESKYK